MVELVSPPSLDPVFAYRCSWIDYTGFLPFHATRPKPQHQDFPTKDEAVKYKTMLRRRKREIVITVTPVRVRQRGQSGKALTKVALDAAGWPVQQAPERDG